MLECGGASAVPPNVQKDFHMRSPVRVPELRGGKSPARVMPATSAPDLLGQARGVGREDPAGAA